MSSALTFVIPVIHPENAKDWNQVKGYLVQTAKSIAAQDSDSWNAVVVANRGWDLPDLPANVAICWVDFPRQQLYERGTVDKEVWANSVRYDKGRRILAGLIHLRPTGHVMIVDQDDFVHRGLTRFVQQNPNHYGWYVPKGYIWPDQSRFMLECDEFCHLCGTCHIIRADLYNIPASMEDARDEYIRMELGSHVVIQKLLQERGTPLEPFPFRAAVWRVGHSGSYSRSAQLIHQVYFPGEPRRTLNKVRSLRWKTRSLEKDFFAAQSR